ncbi:transposase [Okeania sp. SIO2C9]|uniref:transposase n=1 Tax=Okeania sp. SIO2C9 TaxID=2607791 RepID=UPI00345E0034
MSDIKILVVVDTVIEVRIVPATACYIIEIVYEKRNQPQIDSRYVAGIDLGIDRIVALSTNKPGVKPLLINGKPLKSVNQLYNKRKAKHQSHLKGNRKSSRIY